MRIFDTFKVQRYAWQAVEFFWQLMVLHGDYETVEVNAQLHSAIRRGMWVGRGWGGDGRRLDGLVMGVGWISSLWTWVGRAGDRCGPDRLMTGW